MKFCRCFILLLLQKHEFIAGHFSSAKLATGGFFHLVSGPRLFLAATAVASECPLRKPWRRSFIWTDCLNVEKKEYPTPTPFLALVYSLPHSDTKLDWCILEKTGNHTVGMSMRKKCIFMQLFWTILCSKKNTTEHLGASWKISLLLKYNCNRYVLKTDCQLLMKCLWRLNNVNGRLCVSPWRMLSEIVSFSFSCYWFSVSLSAGLFRLDECWR